MEKFSVEVTETLQRTVIVEAENANDAEILAKKAYRNQDIVLDHNDFIGEPEIKCMGKITM